MMPYTMPFLASLENNAAVALLRFSSVRRLFSPDHPRPPGAEEPLCRARRATGSPPDRRCRPRRRRRRRGGGQSGGGGGRGDVLGAERDAASVRMGGGGHGREGVRNVEQRLRRWQATRTTTAWRTSRHPTRGRALYRCRRRPGGGRASTHCPQLARELGDACDEGDADRVARRPRDGELDRRVVGGGGGGPTPPRVRARPRVRRRRQRARQTGCTAGDAGGAAGRHARRGDERFLVGCSPAVDLLAHLPDLFWACLAAGARRGGEAVPSHDSRRMVLFSSLIELHRLDEQRVECRAPPRAPRAPPR